MKSLLDEIGPDEIEKLQTAKTPADSKKQAHAICSPSSASRWTKCSASNLLSKGIEGAPTPYAEEGTLAHEYIAKALPLALQGVIPQDVYDSIEDEEMAFHVENYVNFVVQLHKKFTRPDDKKVTVLIEERVELTPSVWGTLDLGILAKRYVPGANQHPVDLIICDFKYGQGVKVSAKDNLQLMIYALAIDQEHQHTLRNVYLYIYQPRVGSDKPYQRYQPTRKELKETYDLVKRAARESLLVMDGDKPPTYTTGDHCRFCKGAAKCPALAAKIKEDAHLDLALLEANASPVKKNGKEHDNYSELIPKVPIDTLVELYEKKKLIEHYLDSVERYLMIQLENGRAVPGYKLVRGRTRRQWKKDVDAIATKLLEFGIENPYKKTLLNIGDVEKKLGKGKLDELTEQTEAKLQLAKEEDEREAVDLKSALDLLDNTPL